LCKIYRNPANAKDTVPLLSIIGEKSGMTAPAAWARV
jgi:hypothetical protein